MRSDSGPDSSLFVANAVLRWLLTAQIETALIDSGKPWQNGVDESFNGKFRHEHLSSGLGARGMPLGLQLVGGRLQDVRLLQVARWCAEQIGFRHSPPETKNE